MKTTPNLGLRKPEQTDFYNVDDFNYNADVIDEKLKEIEDGIKNIAVPVTSVNGKTGDIVLTADDVGAETPAGAQAKAEAAAGAVQAELDAHLAQNVLMNEVHGMRVNSETKLLEYWDGEEYAIVVRRPPMNVFYNEGNENIDVTGGWVIGYVKGYAEFDKESTHLYLYSKGRTGSPSDTGQIGISTEFKINLSRLRYLKIEWENNAGSEDSSVYFLVGETQSGGSSEYIARVQEDRSFNRKVSILDVSSLSGEYYIRVHAASTVVDNNSVNRVKIYKIWGEE